MLIDLQSKFSDAQAVTSTAISSNVLDLNPSGGPNATMDPAPGEDVWLAVMTVTAITDVGSDATLTVTLESDVAASLASSPVVHYSTGTLAFASYSAAGSIIALVRLPSGTYKRYLGLRYTVASGPFTAGAITAYLTTDIQRYVNYANGFSVQ